MSVRIDRMVGLLLSGLAVCALALAPAPARGEEKESTLRGEVLDLACYLSGGMKGSEHASCARACAQGGQPMGLLADDGKVYTLIASHNNMKPYQDARDLAGAHVEIKGTVYKQGALAGIEVHAIAAK